MNAWCKVFFFFFFYTISIHVYSLLQKSILVEKLRLLWLHLSAHKPKFIMGWACVYTNTNPRLYLYNLLKHSIENNLFNTDTSPYISMWMTFLQQ